MPTLPSSETKVDLNALIMALPLGVVVQDASGAILTANPAAERILGLDSDQLQGRTSLDPRWRALHEDGTDFPGEEHPAMSALRHGRPVRDVVMGIFNPHCEAYTWVNINAFPQFQPGAAQPFQVFAFFEDITARWLAEQAQRESAELYAVAFHSSPVAMSITRPADGALVDLNAAYMEFFGLTPAARGRSTLELGLYDDPAQRQTILRELQIRGTLRDYEAAVRDRSGGRHHVLLSAAPITVGGQTCLLSMLVDITERRQLEAERRQWADAFTHCAHGIALGDPATGRILTCNPAFARLQGRGLAEIVGAPILTAYAAEDRARVQAAIAEADRAGGVRYEAHMLRSDGTAYPVQMDVVSVRDAAGQIVYRVATQQDITERRRLEAQQRRGEQVLRLFVEHSPAAIAMFDRDMRYIVASRRYLADYGLAEQDLTGRSHYAVFPEIPERWRAIHRRCLAGGIERAEADPFPRSDGHVDWVRWEIRPWLEADGQIGGLILFSEVITERKQVELQLQALAARQKVLVQASHAFAAAGQNRQTLFEQIVRHTAEALGAVCGLRLIAADGERLEMAALYASDAAVLKSAQEVAGRLSMRVDAPDYIRAALRAERVSVWPGLTEAELRAAAPPEYWPSLAAAAAGARLLAPVRARGQTLGLLIITRGLGQPEFGEAEVDLAQDLAERAALAISNARLFEQAQAELEERRRVEAELRASQSILATAEAVAGVGSWQWDLTTFKVSWSDEMFRLFGIAREGFDGDVERIIQARVHPDDLAAVRASNQSAVEAGRPQPLEYRLVLPDGTRRVVWAEGRLIHDAAGRPVALAGYVQDITERRQAEQALAEERNLLARRVAERTADLSRANADLEAAARLKDEFLSNMSHELRTPLNAVLSLSESLQEGVYGPLAAPQVQALQTIAESGRHLLDLINDILDLSKLEAGQLSLRTEAVDAHVVCEAALRLVRQAAAQKRLGLALKIDGGASVVAADERRLKQILLNLLSNAVKFTPPGGQVGLEVAPEAGGEAVRFTVWDTGIGIPADQLGRLFRPFSQIDNRLSREHAGTGLGLALVRRLTELHGGSVAVESEPGRGSRFTVLVPQPALPLASPGPDRAGAEPADGAASPGRALVIEDSPSAAAQLSHYLGELRAEIIVHPRGAGAVEQAAAAQPDVILLDLLLPDLSGWEVLAGLRADPRTRAIPILIISVVDDRERGLAAGAKAYLVKPITREELHAALRRVLGVPAAVERPVALVIAPAEAPAGGPGPLILLAEDNPINQISIRDFLIVKGYRIELAVNGQEALARAAETRPDLILMDIQMPVMDGLEAIRRLRAQPAFAAVPIIALTALAMPGDRERCLAAGASHYLTKPVGLRDLAQTIAGLLPARA